MSDRQNHEAKVRDAQENFPKEETKEAGVESGQGDREKTFSEEKLQGSQLQDSISPGQQDFGDKV